MLWRGLTKGELPIKMGASFRAINGTGSSSGRLPSWDFFGGSSCAMND